MIADPAGNYEMPLEASRSLRGESSESVKEEEELWAHWVELSSSLAGFVFQARRYKFWRIDRNSAFRAQVCVDKSVARLHRTTVGRKGSMVGVSADYVKAISLIYWKLQISVTDASSSGGNVCW